MSILKPVLVGQGPSRSGAGRPPFEGRSGALLAGLLGVTLDEFLAEVEAVNLLCKFCGKQLRGKGDLFPMRQARKAASILLPLLRGRLVLAAGKLTAAALGVERPVYFEEVEVGGCLVVTLPHPSGINRWYNSTENRRRAARELRRLLGSAGKEKPRPRGRGQRRTACGTD